MPSQDSVPLTAKGRRSREAILAAASARFEAQGFERTTIRSVAEDAGIDAAMVIRYFGSKEHLFAEATTIDLELSSLREADGEDLGHALARHAVALWESDSPGRALRTLLAASPTDPEATERMRRVFSRQVAPLLDQRVPDAALRAGFVTSQILGYALARYVLRLAPLASLDDSEAAAWLGGSLQHLIDGS